jgi:hypothetical protein
MTTPERSITIPADVMAALNSYADVERENIENPLVKRMITGKSIAQHILKNEVQKRGYYKPQTKKENHDTQ